MKCEFCGVRAKFAPFDLVGWFDHKPDCPQNIKNLAAPTPEEREEAGKLEYDVAAIIKARLGSVYTSQGALLDCAGKIGDLIAQALATAHARGRAEGLEAAAQGAESWGPEWQITVQEAFVRQEIAATIRALRRPPSPREEGT